MYPEEGKPRERKEARIEKRWFLWLAILVALWLMYASLAQQVLPDDGGSGTVNVTFKAVADEKVILEQTAAVQRGANALEELNKVADVETSMSMYGMFVESINQVVPGEKQFWAIYVDREMSPVGIDSIVLDKDMTIEFKLESFE